MASLYKNNGIWYLAITHNGYRKCKSLKTKDSKVAKRLKLYIKSLIIAELNGIENRNENLSFSALSERFLNTNHNWTEATFNLISYILKSHLNKNPHERGAFIKVWLNCFFNSI